MKDIREWYVTEVISAYWTQIKTKALVMLGEPGRGKTPISQIIALAVAEYWFELHGDEMPAPCYRITTDIDFLRGAVGVKTCVDIVDDGDSDSIPIRKLKSLTDVSLEETLSRERWTAVKWVMNQLRIVCDNKYDRTKEVPGNAPTVSHKEFYALVRPAFWADAGEIDIEAILKRAVIVLHTEKWIYIRPATEKRVSVRRIPYQSYDFLKPHCTALLQKWRDGDKRACS